MLRGLQPTSDVVLFRLLRLHLRYHVSWVLSGLCLAATKPAYVTTQLRSCGWLGATTDC